MQISDMEVEVDLRLPKGIVIIKKGENIMVDNRIYLYCPICKEIWNIGKVLYDTNIYIPPTEDKGIIDWHNKTYEWMSKHFLKCYGDRFYSGTLFEVITEYDKRVSDKKLKKK